MCLQRGLTAGSTRVPFSRLHGASRTLARGDFSLVSRNLMTKAWPPMAFALPGRIREVETPPEMVSP